MKKLLSITFLGLLFFNSNYSLVLAHHANEKYCFDCMHKYKIGDKKKINKKALKNILIFLMEIKFPNTSWIFLLEIKIIYFNEDLFFR